jgi:hypothetical protein
MLVSPEFVDISSEQRIADARITFTLSDFKVGDANDIVNQKATDFVSLTVDKKLQVDRGQYSYIESGRERNWLTPHAHWAPARPEMHEPILEMTFNGLYEAQWEQKRPVNLWQTYASYLVTVTFKGETRGPYKDLHAYGWLHSPDTGERR